MSTLQLFPITSLGVSIIALISIISAPRIAVAKNISLITLSFQLVLSLALVFTPLGSFVEQQPHQLVNFILLGNLLAVFYTPAFSNDKKVFMLILVFNFFGVSLWSINLGSHVWVAIPAFFIVLATFNTSNFKLTRLLMIFGLVISASLLFSIENESNSLSATHVIELVGVILFCGLFPISPWYTRFFEGSSTGMLAASFIVQVVIIMKLEQQQALVRDSFLLALPILASLSLLISVSQNCARRAMAGIAASQLAFLAFAVSGEHFSDIASLLLAQSQLITIPGLILTVGILETRIGKLSLARPSGHYESYPKLATTMLLFGLMGAGFPLSLAYVAEDLVLESSAHETPMQDIIWLFVTALAAIAVVKLYLYLCHGGRNVEQGIDILPSKLFAAIFASFFLFVTTISLPS